MNDLQFQPPPDWLIQQYINRPNPAVEALQGAQSVMKQYADAKDAKQKEALAQQAKDIEMAKGLAGNGQDFMDAYKQVIAARTPPAKVPFSTPRAPSALGGSANPDTVNPQANEISPFIAHSVNVMGHPDITGHMAQQPTAGVDNLTTPPMAQPPTPSTGTVPSPMTTNVATDPTIQEYQKDPTAFKKQHGTAGLDKLSKQAGIDKLLNPSSTDYTTDQANTLLKDNPNAASVIASFPKDKVPKDVVHLLITQGKQDVNVGTKESQQQDKLEEQYRKSFQTIRGDPSIKRAEEQRDAAAIAYNRIKEVQDHGQVLNPIDYVDVLGQIYKARTGSAPTNEVLSTARQATAKGSFDKAYTYMTGQQAPATTEDIMKSLQDMALSMGTQADKFHDGYMRNRMKPPLGLAHDRVANINAERGMSFAEATGQNQPGSSGGGQQIPTISDDKSFNALPSGSQFKDPSGQVHRKK